MMSKSIENDVTADSLAGLLTSYAKQQGAGLECFPEDLMAAALSRASSIAHVLSQQLTEPDVSRFSDEIMGNLTWALTALLAEMFALLDLWVAGGRKG